MRRPSSTRSTLLAVVLVSFAGLTSQLVLSAEVKECNVVKKLAKAGHYSLDTVNVTADKDNNICSFSVNGATVDSPPQADVIAGDYIR